MVKSVGGAAVSKLKYASDNTTVLGTIPNFIIPNENIGHLTAKFQRFCDWCEEFAVTIYWPACYMIVLGDCDSMFDTLVRITAALKARLPGNEEDPITVDRLVPAAIILNCEVGTLADKQSLLCTSKEPTCSCDHHSSGFCDMATFYCSTETLINTRSTSHGGAMHELSLCTGSDAVDVFEAPHETTGDAGFIHETLPSGRQIHYLGLNQAQWQTSFMMYAKDLTSTYADVRFIDIYHTLISTSAASHECSAEDAATIKSWHNRPLYLIDLGVPGMPAFYTPASQARSVDSTVADTTKLLVPIIPDLVLVRLSTRSLTLAPLDNTAPKWSCNFLRENILWIAHYHPTPHATKTETVDSTMRQAWWPAVEACALQCHKHCAICTQDIDVERNVGIGIK